MYEDSAPEEPRMSDRAERAMRRDRDRERDGLAQRQDRLSKEQAGLDELLDVLAERIAPILGPERPSAALAGGGSSEEMSSDLTRFLEHVTGREAALAARLRYLIERIDL